MLSLIYNWYLQNNMKTCNIIWKVNFHYLIFGNLNAYPYKLGFDILRGSLLVHHPFLIKPKREKNRLRCLQLGPHF
jgi:hypothetical protein